MTESAGIKDKGQPDSDYPPAFFFSFFFFCANKDTEIQRSGLPPSQYVGETSFKPMSVQGNTKESSVQIILKAPGCMGFES